MQGVRIAWLRDAMRFAHCVGDAGASIVPRCYELHVEDFVWNACAADVPKRVRGGIRASHGMDAAPNSESMLDQWS